MPRSLRRPPLARASLLAALIVATLAATPTTTAVARDAVTVINGRITDAAARPVQGATVTVAGYSPQALSGSDGRYTMIVTHHTVGEEGTLVVRAPGYERKAVRVRLTDAPLTVDVVLSTATAKTGKTGEQAHVSDMASSSAVPASMPAPLMRMESRRVYLRGVAGGTATAAVMSSRPRGWPHGIRVAQDSGGNTEAYDHITENAFRSPTVAPLSTFSVDVDRASYGNVRRFLTNGSLPPRDAVRIEELVNYFPYDDPAPRDGDAPLRISTEVARAPWNTHHDLVRIALRARDVDMRHAPASNLVFLIDVSGSMMGPNRLPLVKQSLALLVNELREEDHVAIVVYAGNAGLVLPSTSGDDKRRILGALERLEAGGSTAGGAGIRLAYDVARQSYIRGGINRVILCTDGDFNVGQSSDGELVRLIEQRRTEGSFLTILGFGMGNYKDAKMEKLAGAGNGNYAYVDDLLEARKMLVKEMGGTLMTVAKDVKLQVEFNPARVQAYRLLGYEDRMLQDEDFANDAKDAGDVGAGHTVTALYEIVPADAPLDVSLPEVAPLRYQRPRGTARGGDPAGELLHVAMRYKAPDGDRSELVTHLVRGIASERPSESMRFASAVAGFGMLLRESPNAGTLTWRDVIALARGARGEDEDGYRTDFIGLAETAARLMGEKRAELPVDRRE